MYACVRVDATHTDSVNENFLRDDKPTAFIEGKHSVSSIINYKVHD